MKVKTDALLGAALDWAVARSLGKRPSLFIFNHTGKLAAEHNYSTDPAQAWPIIHAKRLCVMAPTVYRIGKERHALPVHDWRAMRRMSDETVIHGRGPDGLIAAMRCYVTSELGDEIEIPDELV